MVRAVCQAIKGLPERKVADQVKGCPVIPSYHIEGTGTDVFMEALDQEVNVPLDQGLLLAQGFVREGVRNEAAVARVVGAFGGDEAVGAVGRAIVERRVFGHGGMALAVAVDIFPGVCVDV